MHRSMVIINKRSVGGAVHRSMVITNKRSAYEQDGKRSVDMLLEMHGS